MGSVSFRGFCGFQQELERLGASWGLDLHSRARRGCKGQPCETASQSEPQRTVDKGRQWQNSSAT